MGGHGPSKSGLITDHTRVRLAPPTRLNPGRVGSERHQPPEPPPPRNPPPDDDDRDDEDDEEEDEEELEERLEPHDRVLLELDRIFMAMSRIHPKPEPSASISSSIGIRRLKLKTQLIPATRPRIMEKAPMAKTASGSTRIHQRCF
jgi:hypothetical protein